MPSAATATSKPQLKLKTTHHSPKTYSHLLYVDIPKRQSLMASNIPNSFTSTSPSSTSSVQSTTSIRSSATSHTNLSTHSRHSQTPSPKCAGDHFPLINTLNLSQILPHSVPHTHPAVRCAHHAAQIHNGIIRALSSSYNHCLSVFPDTQDASDFLFYNSVIASTLHRQQQVEGEYLIPELERFRSKFNALRPNAVRTNTNTNTSQPPSRPPSNHSSFKDSLTIYTAYVTTTTAAEYNGLTLRHIIDRFASRLIEHVQDVIRSLLSTHTIQNETALISVWKKAEAMASKDSDIYVSVPFLLGTQDKDFKIDGLQPDFPGLSWGMPWVLEKLVQSWYMRKHAGAWSFAPCELDGKRRAMKQI